VTPPTVAGGQDCPTEENYQWMEMAGGAAGLISSLLLASTLSGSSRDLPIRQTRAHAPVEQSSSAAPSPALAEIFVFFFFPPLVESENPGASRQSQRCAMTRVVRHGAEGRRRAAKPISSEMASSIDVGSSEDEDGRSIKDGARRRSAAGGSASRTGWPGLRRFRVVALDRSHETIGRVAASPVLDLYRVASDGVAQVVGNRAGNTKPDLAARSRSSRAAISTR